MDALQALLDRSVDTLTPEDAEQLLTAKAPGQISVYCGYEPSGPVHMGHLVTILKLKQLAEAGFKVVVLFADYHAWLNRKGDWETIHAWAREWEAIFRRLGLAEADFVLGSSFQRDPAYMDDVLRLSLHTTVHRGLRSMEMIARDFEHARISQLLYPLMQIADIKYLKVDVALGGLEQRKVHALGREILRLIREEPFIAIHTPLITSLTGEGKMSSSKPETHISLTDTPEDIMRKIRKAYAPLRDVTGNPLVELVEHIIFPWAGVIHIPRKEEYGGPLTFTTAQDFKDAYAQGSVHPADVKPAVADVLIRLVASARAY